MDMDEAVMMMVMMSNNNPQNLRNETTTCEEPMTSTADCRSWKLYENPFFHPQPFPPLPQHHHSPASKTHLRSLSARKIGPFSSDLDSELDLAKTQIAELRSELEIERRRRKKAESALAAEQSLRRDLAGKIETDRRRIEAEAKILLEDKTTPAPAPDKLSVPDKLPRRALAPARLVLGEKWVSPAVSPARGLRRGSPAEAENPHIRRGIKGFVEFPRVMRAVGSKSRDWGSKLECQKAQLRILLKQKSSIGSSTNSLIIT